MTRTYLYVDGENFAIRTKKLQEEFARNPSRVQAARALVDPNDEDACSELAGYAQIEAFWAWNPEPDKTRRATSPISYVPDLLYWDAMGLAMAINFTFTSNHVIHGGPRGPGALDLSRSFYFSSASGLDEIDRQRLILHRMGFTPVVLQRTKKADTFSKECLELGVTVVSRPKPLDIALATQVLEDAMEANFDRCIFVGQDEDYTPLLEAVRRRGKEVWLVAYQRWMRPDSRLRFACDRFLPYDPVLLARPVPPPATADEALLGSPGDE